MRRYTNLTESPVLGKSEIIPQAESEVGTRQHYRSVITKVWIDGSSKNGNAQGGVWFEDGTGYAVPFGKGSSNEAEYLALLAALQFAIARGISELEVFSDSALVVNQVNGLWKIKTGRMRALQAQAVNGSKKFTKFIITQIPREQNAKADALSKADVRKDKIGHSS